MQRGQSGFDIGIALDKEWWEEHRSRIEALGIIRKTADTKYDSETFLVFNTLPYEIFWDDAVYFRPTWWVHRTAKKYGWRCIGDLGSARYETNFVTFHIDSLNLEPNDYS